MTRLSSAIRGRWLILSVGLLVLGLAAVLPLAVLAASTGGVKIKIDAENLSTAFGDAGSVGDRLTLNVSDSAGTDFNTLTGIATFVPSSGPSQVFNIDSSTPSSFPDLGQIRLEDSSRPGDHIDIGLATGPLEVRVVFAGVPTIIRFHSGLDKLRLKIGAR